MKNKKIQKMGEDIEKNKNIKQIRNEEIKESIIENLQL